MSEFTEYVEKLRPICEGLHKCFGGQVEFILHDLSMPESSVVLVVGDLTKRQLGAPATNILIRALREEGDNARDIIGYPGMSKDGKMLKSATIFIRNGSGKIIGCFCFNIDLTKYNLLASLLAEFTETSDFQGNEINEGKKSEIFAQGVGEVVEDIIRYEIERNGHSPSVMTKADKVDIVRSLDQKGVFDVKGSPELLAGILGTSVFTVYNYLKEARNGHK